MRQPTRAFEKIAATITVLASALVVAGCSTEPSRRELPTIADFIPRVTSSDGSIVAVLREGSPPAAGSAQAPAYSGIPIVVTGGSSQVSLSALQAFDKAIVAMDGVRDYWELALPSGVSATDLIYNLSTDLPRMTFIARYGVVSGGAVGAYATQGVQVYKVGTGDVQVSIAWSGASDVDLHVTDPHGEEVYFGNLNSASGGELDLDSNAACDIDGVNNENIVWPTGSAPRGTYTVVVDYWDSCGVPRSDYVVTIQRKGHPPLTFTGSFTGAGTPSGTQSATFTY